MKFLLLDSSHFRNFVFSYFCHFSCVIFFTMCSVLNFCLAHLALQMHTQYKKWLCNIFDQNEKQKYVMNSAFVSSLEKSFIFLIFTSNLIKFNILSPSRYELRTPPRSSSQRRQLDLTLLAGQKVVKKYRRYARNNEFRRLKALVPSLLKKNEASKVK